MVHASFGSFGRCCVWCRKDSGCQVELMQFDRMNTMPVFAHLPVGICRLC